MKKHYLLIILLILCGSCQNGSKTDIPIQQYKQLEGLCKLWGFLKYYHPEIGSGELNWDSVLLCKINTLKTPINQHQYNETLLSIIPEVKIIDSIEKIEAPFLLNFNSNIFSDTSLFSQSIRDQCQQIIANKSPYKNFYIHSNTYSENPLLINDSLFYSHDDINLEIRLLGLFRLWNIINYYYPYKYLLDNDWNSVLQSYIPQFMNAEEKLDYYLIVRRLLSEINDNHVFVSSKLFSEYFGPYTLPIELKAINENYLISNIYVEMNNSIKIGDVLKKIDGVDIQTMEKEYESIISASNKDAFKNMITYYLCRTEDSIAKIEVSRNHANFEYTITAFDKEKTKEIKSLNNHDTLTFSITDEITYINLENLKYYQADSVLNTARHSKIIILDLRNNCNYIIDELSSFLFEKPIYFYDYLVPNYNFPGIFSIKRDGHVMLGNPNQNPYDGEIIVLINENTQSIGEFTTMLLERYSNTLLIGSTTAGADGNVSIAYLPGKLKVYFSGLGIYYPGFSKTQRVGIKPEIVVKPTLNGIVAKNDEVLNFAIQKAKDLVN